MYELVDLSQEGFTDAPRFSGHPATKIEYIARHEDTAKNANAMTFSCQAVAILGL